VVGFAVLSWLLMLGCAGIGLVAGIDAPRRFRVGVVALGVVALVASYVLAATVDDGQPRFLTVISRSGGNAEDVTDAPRGGLYLRSLAHDVGAGLLFGAAFGALARRGKRRRR
jgi:hypothetical protein